MAFRIVSSLNPHHTKFSWGDAPVRSWYHESIDNKQDLLITVGDSWTWGDSLGKIDLDQGIADDLDYRVNHVFGNLLAQKLNSDFLMMAKCGSTNAEIHDFAFRYIDEIRPKYNKIRVVITLTELCREITGDSWWLDPSPSMQSLDSFLVGYESNMLKTFASCMAEHPDVQWIWARNFTETYQQNHGCCPGMIGKSWVDILDQAQDNISDYPRNVRILSQLGFVPLEEYLKIIGQHKQWRRSLYDIMASASLAIDWLDDSDLNYKKATKHPTELGHELWADYLYNHIKNLPQ